MSDYSREYDMQILGLSNLLQLSTKQMIYTLHSPTYLHCKYLSIISRYFGEFLQLSDRDLQILIWGAYLHDIGKNFISSNILDKPCGLSHHEWEFMKLHPTIDNETLLFPKKVEPIIPIIQCHHERWDGSGYPKGLAKKEIPYLARVVQLIDIYDALTHTRSYKKTFSSEKAIEIILEETARGWYEPTLVEQFIEFMKKQSKKDPHPISLTSFSYLHTVKVA